MSVSRQTQPALMQTPRGALAPEFRSSGRPTKWGDRQQHRSDWDDSPAAVRTLPAPWCSAKATLGTTKVQAVRTSSRSSITPAQRAHREPARGGRRPRASSPITRRPPPGQRTWPPPPHAETGPICRPCKRTARGFLPPAALPAASWYSGRAAITLHGRAACRLVAAAVFRSGPACAGGGSCWCAGRL